MLTYATINHPTLVLLDIQREYISPDRAFYLTGISPSLNNCRILLKHARQNYWPINSNNRRSPCYVIRKHCGHKKTHVFRGFFIPTRPEDLHGADQARVVSLLIRVVARTHHGTNGGVREAHLVRFFLVHLEPIRMNV